MYIYDTMIILAERNHWASLWVKLSFRSNKKSLKAKQWNAMCKTFFNKLIVAVMWYAGLPRWPLVKNLPAMQDRSLIPGLERSLEKEMATHYSILAWEIPWAEEPDELHSMGVTNKSDMTEVTQQQQQQCDLPVPLAFLTGVEKKIRSSLFTCFHGG